MSETLLVFHNLQAHLAALHFENLFRDDPLPWFVGKAHTVVPGHSLFQVSCTALQESCLEALCSASRKTDFVWCICGGEKYGLGRQKLPLTEC